MPAQEKREKHGHAHQSTQPNTHTHTQSHACTQTRSCSSEGVWWQAQGQNNFLRFVMWNPVGILYDRKQRPRHRGGLVPLSHTHPLYYFVLQWWKEVCASQRPVSPNYFNTGWRTGRSKVNPPAAFCSSHPANRSMRDPSAEAVKKMKYIIIILLPGSHSWLKFTLRSVFTLFSWYIRVAWKTVKAASITYYNKWN